ncbi:hypothetical protein CC99x_005775 [Candidatus Berkiella cookevillensis]|uniref:Uncharacterized protein n=1 Tax=Candidatus Berkiella cookevillensis TaxID=437022 RepID=A0A0Q9YRF1_9GAMM|nr:hypothetical protein [Candidatus Berkiella cookevillensis]MCS5708412.1 hypothetical protein [Candidatus Berkiella cookevillensis]
MKYYVVPAHALSFKEDAKVIVPSKEAVKANLLEMLATLNEDNDATIAFTRRADAEKFANEFDSKRKDHEGFAVIEIAAPKKEYNRDSIEITVANGKKEKLKGELIPYANMTFVRAHLGHLDASLKRETVAINEKGSELIAQASKPVVVEQPAVEPATKDVEKAAEKAKEKAPTSFSIKSFAMGLLATAAFGAAAYAAMISGVTPALLAYFGVKAGFAATLAASAGLVAATSAVAYAAVRVATSFVKFVASKFRGSKAEETATEKPAEDAAKDSKEIPDCCKAKVSETTAEAKTKTEATVEVKEDAIESAINSAKVLRFTPSSVNEVRGAIKFATGSAQLENEDEVRGAIKHSFR